MKVRFLVLLLTGLTCLKCKQESKQILSDTEKLAIADVIQKEIDTLILAVSTKDIDLYMKKMPSDFVIYDESGDVISREQQKQFALRDWSIIDTTLSNAMVIDSIDFAAPDSIFVYTSQRWERMMFRKDGITKDTVLTTQRHRDLWKKKAQGWVGYDVEELGGSVFINGESYKPD